MTCVKHMPGTPVDPSITKGLQQTMDGQGTDGALTMLMHEQQNLRQPVRVAGRLAYERAAHPAFAA